MARSQKARESLRLNDELYRTTVTTPDGRVVTLSMRTERHGCLIVLEGLDRQGALWASDGLLEGYRLLLLAVELLRRGKFHQGRHLLHDAIRSRPSFGHGREESPSARWMFAELGERFRVIRRFPSQQLPAMVRQEFARRLTNVRAI